jgi:dienelactone hydrolase
MEGIAAVMADVRQQYGGDKRYFLTGWEAGGHTVWAMTFRRPQDLRAVAPVCPNYAGRGMQDGGFSTDPSRVGLPIRIFHGENDTAFSPGKPLFVQTEAARKAAFDHGFKNVSEDVVRGKGHEPLAEAVFAYFTSLKSFP